MASQGRNPPHHGWPEVAGYETIRLVGIGGMGMVFEGRSHATGETVAIKVLRPELAGDAAAAHRFWREAGLMRRLRHAGILPILEVSESEGGPFLVLPFAQGGNLAAVLVSTPPLANDLVWRYTRTLAEALEYAHDQGVIHGDLKPSNILLSGYGSVWLGDFGLGRTVPNDSVLNLPGAGLAGSLPYLSPGVVAGKAEDTRRDIYAFGAVLFEMLTGRPPFSGTAEEVRTAILAGNRPGVLALNPAADPVLAAVAERAMARELAGRFASMEEVRRAMDGGGETTSAAPAACSLAGKPAEGRHADIPVRGDARTSLGGGGSLRAGKPALRERAAARNWRWVGSRMWPAGAGAVGILALASFALAAWWMRPAAFEPRRVFFEDFEGTALNESLWAVEPFLEQRTPGSGRGTVQAHQGGGSFFLESRAKPVGGRSVYQHLALKSRVDLRTNGPVRVWAEFDAEGTGGSVFAAVSSEDDGRSAPYERQAWFWSEATRVGHPIGVQRLALQVDLSPENNVGLARWGPPGSERMRIVDLGALPDWHWVFGSRAVAAAEMQDGNMSLRIWRVWASNLVFAPTLCGVVRDAIAGAPLAGVRLRNRTTAAEATTDELGQYVVPAARGVNRLDLVTEELQAEPRELVIELPRDGLGRLDVAVRREEPEPGDAVEAFPELPGNAGFTAVASGYAWWIEQAGEPPYPVWRRALRGGPVERLGATPGGVGIACVRNVVYTIDTYTEAYLHRLEPRGGSTRLFGLPTWWPMGLGHDGTNFWMGEFSNEHTGAFRLWVVDGETGREEARIETAPHRPVGVACLGGRVWVATAEGWLLEIDPVVAKRSGRLDEAVLRRTQRSVRFLTGGDGALWGTWGNRLFRLKVE